jgi:NDP-sugar pyrophosphorylase family protein
VYALSTKNLKYLKKDQEIDMISFLEKLKYFNKKLIAFPIYEGWLDLGKKKNLAKFLKNKN